MGWCTLKCTHACFKTWYACAPIYAISMCSHSQRNLGFICIAGMPLRNRLRWYSPKSALGWEGIFRSHFWRKYWSHRTDKLSRSCSSVSCSVTVSYGTTEAQLSYDVGIVVVGQKLFDLWRSKNWNKWFSAVFRSLSRHFSGEGGSGKRTPMTQSGPAAFIWYRFHGCGLHSLGVFKRTI